MLLFLFIIFTFLYSVIRRRQGEGHRRWCIQTCRWRNRHFGRNFCLHSTWVISFRDIRIQCRYLQPGPYAVGDVVRTTVIYYNIKFKKFGRVWSSCERRSSSRAWKQMQATSSFLGKLTTKCWETDLTKRPTEKKCKETITELWQTL